MKIFDVIQFHSPLSGGIKRYVTDKAKYFENVPGVEHGIIVPGARDDVTRVRSSRLYTIRSLPVAGSVGYRLLLSRWKILQILSRENPDVVEVGDPYYSAWVCLDHATRYGIPVVGYYHSDFPRALGRTTRKYLGRVFARISSVYVNAYLRRLYGRMDVTVAATPRVRRILALVGIHNTRVIPLGTDISVFFPRKEGAKVRAALGIRTHTRLIAYVGRFAQEKRVMHLPRTLDLLQAMGTDVHLLLVGDGPLRRKLQKAAARRPAMTVLPYCSSKEELAHIYSAADLCIYPGSGETFGFVSVEAQACGTPVLLVRGGGADDTVVDGDLRCFSQSHHPTDLASSAFQLLSCAPITWEQRWERHRHIADHFDGSRTFSTLLNLYRELVEHRERSGAPESQR